jgi:hypothetical protein
MSRCPGCMADQLRNTLFCDICGAEIVPPSAGPGAGEPSPLVRCNHLDGQGEMLLRLDPELVLGRRSTGEGEAPDVDLTAWGGQSGGVSRRHARLRRVGEHLYLEDLHSLNGTFINDQRLTPNQQRQLREGDTVRLGLLQLTFRIESSRQQEG